MIFEMFPNPTSFSMDLSGSADIQVFSVFQIYLPDVLPNNWPIIRQE
jgi:hypothetical protein